MDTHVALITALTAALVYLFQKSFCWLGKPNPDPHITYGLAVVLGFALYTLDGAYPGLFGEWATKAFTGAMALPAAIGIVGDWMAKANPSTATSTDSEVQAPPIDSANPEG